MKWLIGLLLLINMLVLAYFKLSQPIPVGMPGGHEPIQPEMIKILTPEQLALIPKKPTPVAQPSPVVSACYEWGGFSAGNLSRAKNILQKLAIDFEVKPIAQQDTTRYWVYIPPLASAEKAQAKIEEVRALGVKESFIIQDPQWRNAISLGVFKDETLASKLLEELHDRGVKSAIKGMRNHDGGQSSITLKNVSDTTAAELEKLFPDFSGSELKKAACQ